ncbi:dihydrofolate reductase (plasmid) [Paenarthrobacter ureafaciens]|uniref:dihydrofolate reductase n=1 Tax=Paenarthrobacter ureafaciens TaxID=37931 RepID=A0AAX3EI24_PAEUR|nr:dihydrofolate reductase [Paenarthrobacter ureafaciens]UYW00084.1 dihydrofolate reductase [Paenarthrobacter ureafaciens]
MSIKMIVAHDRERGIGRAGQLPWSLPGEMKWLSTTTRKTTVPGRRNVLVMGRATYESLPLARRPLAGRLNTVVTSRPVSDAGVLTAASLDAAMDAAVGSAEVEDVFVFGGGRIYEQALKSLIPDELLVSVIDDVFECDTFLSTFPEAYILQSSTVRTYDGTRVFHEVYRRATVDVG